MKSEIDILKLREEDAKSMNEDLQQQLSQTISQFKQLSEQKNMAEAALTQDQLKNFFNPSVPDAPNLRILCLRSHCTRLRHYRMSWIVSKFRASICLIEIVIYEQTFFDEQIFLLIVNNINVEILG